MTTDNKQEQLQHFNIMVIHSLELALWSLFGQSTLAISNMMGSKLLELVETVTDKSITGDTAQDTLTKMGRVFIEEFGIAKECDVNIVDNKLNCVVQGCMLMKMEEDLINSDVKPFVCPFHNVGITALNPHGQFISKIDDIKIDMSLKRCEIKFEQLYGNNT